MINVCETKVRDKNVKYEVEREWIWNWKGSLLKIQNKGHKQQTCRINNKHVGYDSWNWRKTYGLLSSALISSAST